MAAASSEAKYPVPNWAAEKPIKDLHLDVFKGGQHLAKLRIGDKVCLLFGRQADTVDVLLEHGSISRKHAIIVHGNPDLKAKGASASIVDLGSANGTFIKEGSGRKPLKPKEPCVLKEGMCIEFGESSRSYYVRGLEEKKDKEAPLDDELGAKRKYKATGYLQTDDNIAIKSGKKRLKPEEHWEKTSFGDDKRKNKFLRLLGAKKKK